MAGEEERSSELRDVLGRFYALSTKDQLGFIAAAREHLGADTWADDEVERSIERRAKSLDALEKVRADLRERGEFDEKKGPTIVQFDASAERLGLDIKSGTVVRVYGRWGEAKKVLRGERARETPRHAPGPSCGGRTHPDS